jgi:sigma-B regulation protein RsbU (phosphoserine phosphatase)
LFPFARRISRLMPGLCLFPLLIVAGAFLCLALTVPVLRAQTFDATSLPIPLGLGAKGLISGGDDMAFARPDFDDSRWLPVDEKKTMRGLFSDSMPQIVWQRIRIKVDPAQTEMGLEANGVSQAYEVYVNGQKLIASGRVNPFSRYTEDARIVVAIPDAQVKTGYLTIAIRARALPRWWMGTSPSFPPNMISIGNEEALRDRAWMTILRHEAMSWALECIGIAVGLVALALFIAQPRRFEYFWLSLAGLTSILELPISLVRPFQSIPASLAYAGAAINSLGGIFIVLMIMAFVSQRVGKWSQIYLAISAILPIVTGWAWQNGMASFTLYQFSQIPYEVIVTVGVLIVLVVHWRRGNREAGILLVPMVLWSFTAYLLVALSLLQKIPSMHGHAQTASRELSNFTIASFEIGVGNLTGLLFFLTIGAIILRRSTRMIHQQALHEGELAAAREIQQVILPEAADTVPGFDVESVYEPAQQVGGDFFQVLPVENDGLLVVVGDVAGKGLPAAMMVSVLVGAIRGVAEYTEDPARILASLNERLIGRTHGGFSTALAAHITEDGWVTIANAGHLSPYLDGRELDLPGALPLGVISGNTYETKQFYLAHGSRLTFYSDGVVEAQNAQGELFGFERARAISTKTAADIVAAAKQFGQEDDITVVAIARHFAMATAA